MCRASLPEIIDRACRKSGRAGDCVELGDALAAIEAQIDAEVGAWSAAQPSSKPALLSDTEAQASGSARRISRQHGHPSASRRPSTDLKKDLARTWAVAGVQDAAAEAIR
jgi:hypothetical protein